MIQRMILRNMNLGTDFTTAIPAPVLQVLRFELRRQPELLGMSVFGYNEVYSVYQPFVKRWRACRGGGGGEAQVCLSMGRI